MLVISSTVYNEIPSEPTVIVVPVFDTEPDTGLGVDLGENDWAAPGLVTSLRKARLAGLRRFDDLFNFVYDPATLLMAFDRVATNRAPTLPASMV